jgi:predicted acylesterase/phospholipase RssA
MPTTPFLTKDKPIRNLVFKGGIVKGVAYVGVRAALEACAFPFDAVERVGGTSAGAMNALAFALNLSIAETQHHILALDFKDLLDDTHSGVSRERLLAIKKDDSFFGKARAASLASLGFILGNLCASG